MPSWIVHIVQNIRVREVGWELSSHSQITVQHAHTHVHTHPQTPIGDERGSRECLGLIQDLLEDHQ